LARSYVNHSFSTICISQSTKDQSLWILDSGTFDHIAVVLIPLISKRS